MKTIRIVIIPFLLIISLIAGFLFSYTFTVVAFAILILLNLINILIPKQRKQLKILVSGLSIISVFMFFYFGIMIRNELRFVCLNSPIVDHYNSKHNIAPVSLDSIENEIFSYKDFEIDTLQQIFHVEKKWFIKKISSKNSTGKIKILIVAGIHGSETASVHAIPKILEKIQSKRLTEDFYFEIIYALNPIGLSLFNRFNESNCDINRDFITFNTVQSQLLQNLLENKKINYVLDLHEGSYGGHYFMDNTSLNNLTENINASLIKEKINRSPMLKNKMKDFLFKYELDNPLLKTKKIATFDNYLNMLGIDNILSESNISSLNFDERIKGHVVVFEALIDTLKE